MLLNTDEAEFMKEFMKELCQSSAIILYAGRLSRAKAHIYI